MLPGRDAGGSTFGCGIVVDGGRIVGNVLRPIGDLAKPRDVLFFVHGVKVVSLPHLAVPNSKREVLFEFPVHSGDGAALEWDLLSQKGETRRDLSLSLSPYRADQCQVPLACVATDDSVFKHAPQSRPLVIRFDAQVPLYTQRA